MKKHAESHLDHGLTSAQISYLLGIEVPEGVVTVRTVELPKALGGLPCALYGPLMGDPPLAYNECRFGQRGNRKGLSRLIDRPPRTTRLVTFVAGPHDGLEGVLFTAYGGPAAPREPWEVPDDADAAAFWSEHALAAPSMAAEGAKLET